MYKKNIRFVIFNEDFWGKGLIYSQNFLQLIKLKENNSHLYNIEIHVFCSFLDLLLYRKEINLFKNEFNGLGIKTIVYPTFFVRSRLFVLRFLVLPLFFINIIPYVLFLNLKDLFKIKTAIIYHLRSYPISLIFTLFYKSNGKLIFDPRSDYINENKTVGFWKENTITDKVWLYFEKYILINVAKTIFISDAFMSELLVRNGIKFDNRKHFVFNNPIDYSKFKISSEYKRDFKQVNFLYTGSLGNWNNLETYLDFFLNIKTFFSNSKLIVATSTDCSKFEDILIKDKYAFIIDDIEFFYNLSYDELPLLYKRCSVGLQLMDFKDSRLGVKFVEYLASGLLPVVNYNVLGAAQFCREGYGIIIEDSFASNYRLISDKIKERLNDNLVENSIVSKEYFDVNITYKNLKLIYA